jgi:hypothetical protein
MTARTPSQLTRLVGLVMLGVIAVTLLVFLAITMWHGDPTDDREDNQPEPSPEGAGVVRTVSLA